ncbi:hypothetical protein HXX76_002010 [Chlamydomonas incerta]|uniref:Survival protein SurE-like phosphatase/nucleotidase domain-containing protein n=1 Tax=Chlamydomonas incerta TaxID=51695 RepID=A0A836B033_CHLIN|nr:hypothetical protein HXX76_002010 [Chlamydomonas incerta]|eukprot:KAG2443661.1 hypothetical protein HXX76_002010 [Chlamydomonas incerta]
MQAHSSSIAADATSSTDGVCGPQLQELGLKIKELIPQVEVLVIGPEASSPTPHASSNPSSSGSPGATSAAGGAGSPLHFDAELPLRHHASAQLPLTFSLGGGASAADCVLAAADHSAGLAAGLGLSPVLLVSGVHRGPALGADLAGGAHPALALARHASLLGLPSVAACLATPTPGAPLRPAVDAAATLVAAAVACLRRGGGWPRARNMPRSHFPFPTRGRWSLGREVPLPREVRQAAAADAAAGGGAGAFAAADCWALGEDSGFWAGGNGSSSGPGSARGSGGGESAREAAAEAEAAVGSEARRLLRDAFAEGDVLLVLNTPPTWPGVAAATARSGSSRAFAAARPGVLWPCYQVEPRGLNASALARGGAGAGGSGSRTGSSRESSRSGGSSIRASDGAASPVSWQVQGNDLYGRSLPRADFGAVHDRAGAFVGQDNTAALVASSASPTVSSWTQREAGGESRVAAEAGRSGGGGGYSRSNWRQALEDSSGSAGGGTAHGHSTAADGVRTHMESPQPHALTSHVQSSSNSSSSSGSRSAAARSDGSNTPPSAASAGPFAALSSLPASFVLRRGTTLTDSALAGDVEAIMARRAAVVALPAWPYGHPFSPADRLGAAALAEGRDGLPLWLVEGEDEGRVQGR